MTLPLHDLAITTYIHGLETLAHLLTRGAEKLGAEELVELRLAPDMYPVARQVQFVCLQALDAAARLSGRTPAPAEHPQETLAQLQERIAAALAELRAIPAGDLVGGEDRPVRRPLGDEFNLEMTGFEYLRDFSLPNFYFHLVTTYAILRNHGVDLGKRDFMGHIRYALRPRG